jgi:hypothetical protein
MLILIVEREVFVDVLDPVVWRRQAGDSCQFIGLSKGSLTLFKILETDSFGIHRVPVQLTTSVMRMTMKRWNDAMKTESNHLGPKNTAREGLDERTHDIVPKANIQAICLKESLNNGKRVLHPEERAVRHTCSYNERKPGHVQFTTAYHITNDEDMPMSTDSKKNTCNSKKRKHLFSSLRTRIAPALDTCINTLRKLINFSDIKPCDVLTVKVCFRECVDNGVNGIRDGGTGNRQGCRWGGSWSTFGLYM